MLSTIDKAGRVVIPARIRQQAQLQPGSSINIKLEDGAITISRDVPSPELVRHKGRLIARPVSKDQPQVDISQWVAEERERWPM